MINKVKASLSEKILFIFLILLFLIAFSSYFLLKDKCLFVKKINPNEINFTYKKNGFFIFEWIEFVSYFNKMCDFLDFYIMKSLFVKNVQKNHSTTLKVDKININLEFTDDLFHTKNLKRIPQN